MPTWRLSTPGKPGPLIELIASMTSPVLSHRWGQSLVRSSDALPSLTISFSLLMRPIRYSTAVKKKKAATVRATQGST